MIPFARPGVPVRPAPKVDQRRGRQMVSWRASDVDVKRLNKMAATMQYHDKAVSAAYKLKVKDKVLEPTVREIKIAAARSPVPQTKIAVRSVKINNKAQPMIVAGGTKSLASQLLYGSEFGQGGHVSLLRSSTGKRFWRKTTRQFKAPHAKYGYWFFPTVEGRERQNIAAIKRIFVDAIDDDMAGV